MLRKSIPTFKIGILILLGGFAVYFFNEKYGRVTLGLGLITISCAMVLYILFMFRRYGEKKNTH